MVGAFPYEVICGPWDVAGRAVEGVCCRGYVVEDGSIVEGMGLESSPYARVWEAE